MGVEFKRTKTFNKKIQWLKLYDRKPEYIQMVDKYIVHDFVRGKIGEEHLIRLICVWDSPDDIDFDALSNKFIMTRQIIGRYKVGLLYEL